MLHPRVLTELRWDCVHFVTSSEIDENTDLSGSLLVQANFVDVKSESQLLDALSRLLNFPDYFGHNWDALNDCLRDMQSWIAADGYVLQIHGAEAFWRNNPLVAGHLVMSWLLAAEFWSKYNVPFHLVFVMK